MRNPIFTRLQRLASTLLVVVLTMPAWAGGSPLSVLVVVNGSSPISRAVAEEYVALRGIPEEHVLVLEGVPGLEVITVVQFREHVWKPIGAFLDEHALREEIDTIAYSADFPYAVDFTADLGGATPDRTMGRLASLTGATYLGYLVAAEDPRAWTLGSNRYYRRVLRPSPTDGDRARLGAAMQHLQAGDHAKAASAYEAFLAAYPAHPQSWYNLACCRSLLGSADEAMAALEQAVANGWSDVEHTAADPDLESLRGRPDFEQLLQGMREAGGGLPPLPTRAFSVSPWSASGEPAMGESAAGGDRYLLAICLAYTGVRGNSLPEVRRALASAAASDGTNPDGTVYFCKNGDVRSTTREPLFVPVRDALRAMGRKAEILSSADEGQDGVLPQGKSDVSGAVIGRAGFSWQKSGSKMLPGALCEHLTSWGADFRRGSQTKLSELLRHGSAGASGTVTEPLAIFQKFPSPAIHLHYARGASLVEAFYQSVAGPYQLLVVGDPLARPFARFATIQPPAGGRWTKSSTRLRADVTPAPGTSVATVEAWVGGQRLGVAPAGEEIVVDTSSLEDGVYELRLVAVEDSLVATRTVSEPVEVILDHRPGELMRVSAPDDELAAGEDLELALEIPTRGEIVVLRGHEELVRERHRGGEFSLVVPAERLRPGRQSLTLRFVGEPTEQHRIVIEVGSPEELRSEGGTAAVALSGLAATVTAGGREHSLSIGALDRTGQTLASALSSLSNVTRVELEGQLRIPSDGLWQLSFATSGDLEVELAGKSWAWSDVTTPRHLGARLGAGWHDLRIALLPRGKPQLYGLVVGGAVTRPLAGDMLRHPLVGLEPAEGLASFESAAGRETGALGDGDLETEAAKLDDEGLRIAWKQKLDGRLAAVVLHPAGGGERWSGEWRVLRGRRAVKDVKVIPGPPLAGGKDQPARPAWVRIEFRPFDGKSVVLVPPEGEGELPLAEVVRYVQPSSRR